MRKLGFWQFFGNGDGIEIIPDLELFLGGIFMILVDDKIQVAALEIDDHVVAYFSQRLDIFGRLDVKTFKRKRSIQPVPIQPIDIHAGGEMRDIDFLLRQYSRLHAFGPVKYGM